MLAGREDVLERFEVTLDRLEAGQSADAPLITGSRGLGKTVLVNTLVRKARERGWFVGAQEAIPQTPLPALIALMARDVLMEMSTRHRAADRARRALGILKAFASVSIVGVRLNINTEAVTGTADTGILELDLRRLFVEIGEIAQLQDIGVLFALDEVQTIPHKELRVLHSALHGTAQLGLPVAFLGAGLFPSWQGSGSAEPDPMSTSTYQGRSETLSFVRLDPLSPAEARRALTEPAAGEGVTFTQEALERAVRFCEGSPWLLQFAGEAVWELAPASPIGQDAMRAALARVQDRLDSVYFPRLLRNCSAAELRVLRAIAAAGGRGVDADAVRATIAGSVDVHGFLVAVDSLTRQDLIVEGARSGDAEPPRLSLSVPRLAAYF